MKTNRNIVSDCLILFDGDRPYDPRVSKEFLFLLCTKRLSIVTMATLD